MRTDIVKTFDLPSFLKAACNHILRLTQEQRGIRATSLLPAPTSLNAPGDLSPYTKLVINKWRPRTPSRGPSRVASQHTDGRHRPSVLLLNGDPSGVLPLPCEAAPPRGLRPSRSFP